MREIKISVDLDNYSAHIVNLKQGDSTQLNIAVLKENEPILLSGYDIVLNIVLPNNIGLVQSDGISAEENTLKITLDNRSVGIVGRVLFELQFFEESSLVSSYIFMGNVEPAAFADINNITLQSIVSDLNTAVLEALQAKRQLEIQTSTSKTLYESMSELGGDIKEAETARAAAEQNRATAENARASAETQRGTNETARKESETARGSAESARATAETARASAEQTRVSAETQRGTNEATRKESETARSNAESVRVTAEQARASAEQTRVSAETQRGTNEAARKESETARGNAESARATAETARASAEQNRATAETQRGTNETARKESETARGNAESARVTAEQARVTAESARVTAERNRVTEFNTIKAATIKKYSVRFSGSAAAGVREDNAVGMVANVAVGDETVVNDFDSVSFFDRPICCCTFDSDNLVWRVNAYKGEPGFAWDGSNGEVMYECKPCAHSDNTDLNTYVSVTGTPCEGYTLFECFKDWNTKLYLPVFNLAMVDGKAASRAGYFPEQESNTSAMTHARTFHTKASSETIEAYFYETCLQLVEFATKDLQTKMMGASTLSYNGADTKITSVVSSTVFKMAANLAAAFVAGQSVSIGSAQNGTQRTPNVVIASIEADPDDSASSIVTLATAVENLAAGDYLSSRMYVTGAAAKAVTNASSGSPVSNTSGKYPCIWRGKENPWGNGFSCISNLLIKRNGEGTDESPYTYKPFYLPYPEKYSNGAITDDYIEVDFNIPGSSGYVKSFGRDGRYPFLFITKEIGGSSTTYGCAYYTASPNAVGGVRVGGSFINGRSCGLFFDCYSAPSSTWVYYCSRLFCNP